LVGAKLKKFRFHKKLLLSKSGLWKEKDNQSMLRLDGPFYHHQNDSSDAFALIFDWMRGQNLNSFPDHALGHLLLAPRQDSEKYNCYSNGITELIEVYHLASKMEMAELMDLVINQLGNACYEKRMWPSSQDFKRTYLHAKDHPELRNT
jgi:hypothetical protein